MSEHATIVDDAMLGYTIIVTYDSKRFVATVSKDSKIAIRAVFYRGHCEAQFSEEVHPLRQLVDRVNEHLYKYTHSRLYMPGEMQSVHGLWSTKTHPAIATTW
jgi:hypothetical protein